MREIKIHGIYKHFKGDSYLVEDASDDISIPAGKPTDGILYIYTNNN